MADPEKPAIDYSYSGFQAEQQNFPFPGSQLDNDLAALKSATDQTIDALAEIRRADGSLKNGIVTADALAAGVKQSMGLDPGLVDTVTALKEATEAAAGSAETDAATATTKAAEATAAAASVGNAVADVNAVASSAIDIVNQSIATATDIRDEVASLTEFVPIVEDFVTAGAGPYDMGVEIGDARVLDVVISGVLQEHGTYTIDGTEFTLDSVPPAGLAMQGIIRADVRVVSVFPEGSVGSAQLAGGAVVEAKYGNASIPTTAFKADSIPEAAFKAESIPETAFQDESIPETAFQAASIPEAAFKTGSVPGAALKDGEVTEAKLHPDVVAQLGGGDGGGSVSGNFRYMLNSCRPERLSATVLRILPGSFASSNGATVYSFDSAIDINTAVVGANGRDHAGAMVGNADYFVYLIRQSTTGDIRGLVSRAITYGSVIVPSGHTLLRKLPFGFVWRTVWPEGAGIATFHMACWPSPMVTYTAFQMSTPFTVSGNLTDWASLSLGALIPDNARLALIQCKVVGSGSAFVRSTSDQPTGIPVYTGSILPVRVQSNRSLLYKIVGSATLIVGVMGFYMTEHS